MSLASEIAGLLEVYDRKWKIDGELKQPTESDVAEVLDRMRELLYDDSKDIGSIEVGMIMVRRDGDHTDVFLHIGELDAKDS